MFHAVIPSLDVHADWTVSSNRNERQVARVREIELDQRGGWGTDQFGFPVLARPEGEFVGRHARVRREYASKVRVRHDISALVSLGEKPPCATVFFRRQNGPVGGGRDAVDTNSPHVNYTGAKQWRRRTAPLALTGSGVAFRHRGRRRG